MESKQRLFIHHYLQPKILRGSTMTKLVNSAGLLGKYTLVSLLATVVDFSSYAFGRAFWSATAFQATILGQCLGSLVAFWYHRTWVFYNGEGSFSTLLVIKYFTGVLVTTGLNVLGVWLLHDFLSVDAWVSRISVALVVWCLGFVFNKTVVFKEIKDPQEEFDPTVVDN